VARADPRAGQRHVRRRVRSLDRREDLADPPEARRRPGGDPHRARRRLHARARGGAVMLRRLFDATIGRRLVFRIWAHGLALFGGVIATALIARWAMRDLDATSTMRAHPYIAVAIAERVLPHADDPQALDRELA